MATLSIIPSKYLYFVCLLSCNLKIQNHVPVPALSSGSSNRLMSLFIVITLANLSHRKATVITSCITSESVLLDLSF